MNRIIIALLKTEAGKRVELQILLNLFTSSLGLPRRRVLFMSSGRALDEFASFTSKHLCLCNEEQQVKLHANSLKLGAALRSLLFRRDNDSLTSLVFLLYRNIGIEMSGCFPGEVRVSQCHFSRFYTPRHCMTASLMDSGVICGLLKADSFDFSERITQGSRCCRCELIKKI